MPSQQDAHSEPIWQRRFRLPETYPLRIARGDPTRGLVVSNRAGVDQLYAWQVPTGVLTPLTDRRKSLDFGYLSPDGRFIYYLDDHHGDEIGHLVRVPFGGGPAEDLTPDLPPYAVPFESGVYGLAVSQDARTLAFTIATDAGFQLYRIALGPAGELSAPQPLWHTERLVVGPLLSADGTLALLAATDRGEGLRYRLLALDTTTGQIVGELEDAGASVSPSLCAPVVGDPRVLAMSTQSGFNRPLLWNPRTGERADLALPTLDGDLYPCDWSADGARLLLKQISQATMHLYIYDLSTTQLRRLEHAHYGRIWGGWFAADNTLVAACDRGEHPWRLLALDADSGAERGVALAEADAEALPGHALRSITFRSSDGQQVQGWLGVPAGAGPFPTILETHGGPDNFMTGGFYPFGQAWLDAGFAFLTINYRGSTTFGKTFQEQIWGDPGHWEVEDMVAARAWLVARGIARADRVLLTGRSYGGILTLLALGTYPDLWAGGMAEAAVADCALAYTEQADTLKAYDQTLFKGTPEQVPERYRAASAQTYVERVSAPVLIIQGRHDTRCPPHSIEVYEATLRALGKPIEVHWYDAGHWTSDVAERLAHVELMLAFAQRIVDGRSVGEEGSDGG